VVTDYLPLKLTNILLPLICNINKNSLCTHVVYRIRV
jgi:hypothetical protein